MKIEGSVVLVTGANRGLGAAYARAALAAGARKVYAAARDPASVALEGVVPIALDVTDAAQVAAAARECADVTLLINNAGISRGAGLLDASAGFDEARAEFETNFFGPWAMTRAFAPVLKANGGGAVVNVLSGLGWLGLAGGASYSPSQAAAWSLSNGLRNELRAQGTQVTSVHVAFMDTDMARKIPGDKISPDEVARQTLAAVEAGAPEVLADATTRSVKQGLVADPPVYAAAR